MSEYQYYEFQAIDRPLTKEEIAEVRKLSTRATITTTRFVNVYHWGDFKGEPLELVKKYYDAFLYLANWGTHWFMLRLPRQLLDPDTAALYCACDDGASVATTDQYVILGFRSDEEDGGWVDDEEGGEWLSSLISLRAEMANGDMRPLYLGWLLCAQDHLDDDEVEPPVPPGLGKLTASQQAMVDFLRIGEDLITVAAECSLAVPVAGPSPVELRFWIRALPQSEKDELLLRLLEGNDPYVRTELLRRFQAARRVKERPGADAVEERRTVGQLIAAAEERAEARQREEEERKARERARRAREAAASRAKYLDDLAGREAETWQRVEAFIDSKRPAEYDHAISLLKDLRDLAARKGDVNAFQVRLAELRTRHAKKYGLLSRIDQAQLRAGPPVQ